MAEDGKEKGREGGFRTMPFILANEFCDRFTTVGLNANMITYLTQQLHLPLVEASNTITNFHGTASFTPIIGALIADSFAGRFWTITAGATIYLLGMISLTLSAVLPGLRPPRCTGQQLCQRASLWQLLIFYASLLFTSVGSGGIRPCVVAFGADQFELHTARAEDQKWSFFNFYFFSLSFASLLALTVVVYVQDNVGWGWGLGMPTIAMFISVVAFAVGYPLYIKLKPGGSPLTRLTQVVVAAMKKRKAIWPADPALLYEDKELDAHISTGGRLLHTNQFGFLDRAAIVAEGDLTDAARPRLWRLSTVHRVEELKSIIRMIPIWSVGIMIIASASHNYSFAVQQARTMDRHFSPRFQIPPASMSIFSVITMIISIGFYDRLFVPIARRFTGRSSGITYLQRMGIGLAISVFSNVSAALVETKRKAVAADHGLLDKPKAILPISVFWLIPQYSIHGLSDAFAQVGHMEFLYDQVPESMKSTGAALFWLSASIGNYLGTLMVTLVNNYTKGKGDWLQDNINRGKLDYYYWLVTMLQVLNFVYFIICTLFYTSKPVEIGTPENSLKVVDAKGGGRDADLVTAESQLLAKHYNGNESNGGSCSQV